MTGTIQGHVPGGPRDRSEPEHGFGHVTNAAYLATGNRTEDLDVVANINGSQVGVTSGINVQCRTRPHQPARPLT
jgi:hypothetical protein